MKELETERLILRRFQESDLNDFHEYAKNPNVGDNGGWEPHKDIEMSKKVLDELIEKEYEWAIVYKADNKVIGSVGMNKDPKRRVEGAKVIGYSMSEDYWGKGIMTEAVKRVIKYTFEEDGTTLLAVYHFDFNMRSKHVIEKCGFVFDCKMRQCYEMYDGKIYDDYCYSILKEEYFLNKVREEL